MSEANDWLWVLGRDEATVRQRAYRSKALHQSRIIMCCALMFFLLAALAIGVPWYLQWKSDLAAAAQIEAAEQNVAEWPYPQAELALKAAERYNAVLASSGQPTLGETYDPFSGAKDDQSVDGQIVRSEDDAEYTDLLNAGDSLIGSIIIPKISVNLPIRHGTSKLTLDRGVGHLYGTSMPTGAEGLAGGSAHTVLTGHRGLVEALMFTRLDEMEVGDFMYEKVFGRTLAYRVDRITVIDPSDTSQLRIRSGEDRLTLMTCTPFGVNTHRLLVSGTRVSIPKPAPEPQNAPKDMTRALQWAVMLATGVALAALVAHTCIPSVRRAHERLRCHPRHAGQ
ncbi:sortase family protein [Bifidobacterium italicum]|uniref:Sortase family protein n=1 Tax=Bifidobacterium italicum TaxID=1960968 RepID=A0A2A2ELH2_9BIFI|nr:class C sortase [Bifidobacterium italicum]PAU70019.1 sortase family protein [Bifidobacterium italicum]